jgi:hypothetical protein
MAMTPAQTSAGLAGVMSAAMAAQGDGKARGLPPVHLWHPAHCGDIDIVIKRDGLWFHEGSPIGREALVKLFASILRLDPDGYHLVTPAEKMKITVEDAPFMAVRVDQVGDALRFLTNVGDEVEAGPDHAIRVQADPLTGEPRPYVHVRRGLEARINPLESGFPLALGTGRSHEPDPAARHAARLDYKPISAGRWFGPSRPRPAGYAL